MKRAAPLRRTRLRVQGRRRRQTSAVWEVTAGSILEQARGLCQAKVPEVCWTSAGQVHHVLPRGRGGKDDGSTPLLAVCPPCHAWIHEHPAESYDAGWLVRSGS